MARNFSLVFIMNSGKNRFCNDRCHSALKKPCICICGGLNHGVGAESVLKNIPSLLDRKDNLGIYSIFYRRNQTQLSFAYLDD